MMSRAETQRPVGPGRPGERRPVRAAVMAGAVVLGLLAGGCAGSRAATPSTGDVPTVAVASVERGDLSQTLTLAAEFRPFQEIDVHAKVAGYLKAIYVDVGDKVHAGQLLATLEIPELRDELEQDEAAVRRSAEEIKRAQADLNRTESAHAVAHLSSTRLEGVMKERPNLVAQQDIDDAQGRDRVAEAQVATAQATLAAAVQQLEVSKANRNRTQTLSDYARITAPFDGVVTHRYADTGAMIQAGTSSQSQAMPVIKLSENALLRLTIPVPESAVPRIHVGEAVDVDVPVLKRTFPGTVARFSDKVDEETRTMHTEVDVKNPGLTLVPGMYAQTALVIEEKKGALIVPIQAVDRGDNGATVMIVDDESQIARRSVTIGLETADRLELTSGVREGDRVVIGNRSQLKVGQRVTAKADSGPTAGGEK
jgi:RND family efflux transporter MFP subunit